MHVDFDKYKEKFIKILFTSAPNSDEILEEVIENLPANDRAPFLNTFKNFIKLKGPTTLQILCEEYLYGLRNNQVKKILLKLKVDTMNWMMMINSYLMFPFNIKWTD